MLLEAPPLEPTPVAPSLHGARIYTTERDITTSCAGTVRSIGPGRRQITQIFVSPISRYSIIFGKILGESLVALLQGLAVVVLDW